MLDTPVLHPEVNLVIVFRATPKNTNSKRHARDEASKAEHQYIRLIDTLTHAGLQAVGKKGDSPGQILVFVTWAQEHLENLVRRERQTDFLSGLPVTPVTRDSFIEPLSPADRIRLVYDFISSCPREGGLGISPGSSEWGLIESITSLHDRSFNEMWVRSWKPRKMGSVELNGIREQFGESIGLYFTFLSSYTQFLLFPATLGLFSYFFLAPYSPLYSILLCVWSVTFVEWWTVQERILSLRFGTRGSFSVEKRRVAYIPGGAWWGREIRILASLPVISLFAGILIAILTFVFVTEAFVSELYQGPGRQIVAFSPTIFFAALVPQVLSFYQALAVRLTSWENHFHHSSYSASLTLKTFALSAIVAYMPLGLSAFVYVPFGEGIMRYIQHGLFSGASKLKSSSGPMAKIFALLDGNTVNAIVTDEFNAAASSITNASIGIWDVDVSRARQKLKPARLRDQMFAYTVTNQIVNTFKEIGLPFVMRFVINSWNGRLTHKSDSPDRVSKEGMRSDESERNRTEERYLKKVREEVALPEYDLFADYSEMVIQFGYVVLWSTIWPLAPVMALLNNIFESESDAFKLTVHHRRPIPIRTDTMGPWLDALSFLTWLGALTNSALVYLFSPEFFEKSPNTSASVDSFVNSDIDGKSGETYIAMKELLVKAVFVATIASHGYIILRAAVRHIVEKIWWKGSREVQDREREERTMKEGFLEVAGAIIHSVHRPEDQVKIQVEVKSEAEGKTGFWEYDEGVDEIRRLVKEA